MEEGKLQTMPNIEKVTLSDGIERDYIDTYEKLYWIVNERFKLQKEFNPEAEPIIDLTRLIIRISDNMRKSRFEITYFSDIEGITKLRYETNLISDDRVYMLVKNTLRYEVKYNINFGLSIICNIDFQATIFQHDVVFYGTKFISNAYFHDSVFNRKIDISSIECIEIPKDKKEIDLDSCDDRYFLDYIERKKNNINEKDKIDFSDSIFNNDVCLNSMAFFINDFQKEYFVNEYNSLNNIIFDGSYFNKKIKINHVAIGEVSMQNCYFDDSVYITNNKYDVLSSFNFSFSIINSLFIIDSGYIGSNFIDLIINGEKGEPIRLLNEISFSKSVITKDAFILIRNINNGNTNKRAGTLNFEYANVLGTITIQDSELHKIKLDKSTIIGDINIENVETEYDCRESIAKVKDSYLKRNDIVNSLAYKAKEMKYYSEHLNFKSPYLNKIVGGSTEKSEDKKEKDTLEEYVLLNLNRISNSFGMSWERGVFFTCVTALLFFVLINTVGIKSSPLFVWGWNGWDSFGDVWKYYLNMFYLLDFKEKFKDLLTGKSIELNALGDTLFFVSKIFVSYGIYQTISAFRKYGK